MSYVCHFRYIKAKNKLKFLQDFIDKIPKKEYFQRKKILGRGSSN
ncbi:hypothetical protein N786_08810 [Bacillus amyloliquefaciens UASWS BA1]|nr:hypothetical protein N786_08810 [Bacillus amyloliquefaciens UASWS BA1]